MPESCEGVIRQRDWECRDCGVSLDYSMVALLRGYCDGCVPNECPECGCVNIRQRRTTSLSETAWECDNGCFFEVPA